MSASDRPDIRLVDGHFWARDPHDELTWMRAHAPVFWDEAGGVWGIARYEDVLAISKDSATFSNAGGIRPDNGPLPYMIDLDDPEHKRRRNLVSKGFTPRRIADREPRIRQVAIELVKRAKAKGTFDFVNDLAAWLPLIAIGDMLGVDPDHYPQLLEWSDTLLRGTGGAPEAIAQAAAAYVAYNGYQRSVLADRRAKAPQDDLVSILAHAEINGDRLDDEAILAESLLLLIGGDETTRHVMTGGMYQLLRHPEQLALLARAPEKIPTAVEEMLR